MSESTLPRRAPSERWSSGVVSRMSLRHLAGLLLVVGAALLLYFHGDTLFRWAETQCAALGPWAPVLFALVGALLIAATGPASLVNLGAGALFGFGVGWAVAFAAGMLGSTLAYGIARLVGGRMSAVFAERYTWFAVLRDRLATDLKLALGMRLSPVIPLALSSYGFGLARMRLRLFLLTGLAMAPPILLYVAAGATARGVWRSGSRPWWEWALLAVGAIATLVIMARVTRMLSRAMEQAGSAAGDGGPFAASERADGEDGSRRVGVEIELGGVSVEECARAVAHHFGGEVDLLHEGEAQIDGALGEFRVELDSRPVKRLAASLAEPRGEGEDMDVGAQLDELKSRLLIGLAEPFVPVEIVTPPLPMDRIETLDELVADLRERGARGTHDRVFYAFGVHFNPEVPSTDVASILAHMRAFFLLRDWIRRAGDTDLARRVTPHIEPHPDELVERFMAPDYDPTIEELIDDYLRLSPTRNRDLDMLPLLAHLDEERVRAVLPDEKINPRPTYHYRLPNSQVGDPDWRVSDEWKSWLLVEQLAGDPERLARWMADWRAHRNKTFGELLEPWADEVGERLRP